MTHVIAGGQQIQNAWTGMGLTLPCTYNETFAGQTKVIPRCYHCSSEFHSSSECVQAPAQPNPQYTSNLGAKRPAQNAPICYDLNDNIHNKCQLKWCKFAHTVKSGY